MYTKTQSATLKGIEAQIVIVEIDTVQGVPAFNIVGLADKSINESRERITVAMRSAGFEIAPKRIVVNLSPAHQKKEGVQLDLPVAASLMVNLEYVDVAPEFLENFCFFGELSLTGELRFVTGILPLSLEAQKHKIKYLIIPKSNSREASLVNLAGDFKTQIFAVENLAEVKSVIEALYNLTLSSISEELKTQSANLANQFLLKAANPYQSHTRKIPNDLSEVVGQAHAKRGLEIAAAGWHHVLMIGPPGCGKSMLAARFRYLMPELSFDEALEVTKIYSVCALVNDEIILDPPYRAPHHSASNIALVGGGSLIRPGEVTLAHNGVLFLDELTEFNRNSVEQLRQVLENKQITINRIRQTLSFPADFILVAACNPCPCGFMGDSLKACTCTPMQVNNYFGKLSGPLLDRIDIHIELGRLTKEEISLLTKRGYANKNFVGAGLDLPSSKGFDKEPSLPIVDRSSPVPTKNLSGSSQTAELRAKIQSARDFAKTCPPTKLGKAEEDFIDNAVFNLGLSARASTKLLKVARTIANLAFSEAVTIEHLAEALQFRSVDFDKYRK